MKRGNSVDKSVVEWAFLKGDHACHRQRDALQSELLSAPDFSNVGDNATRSEALRQGRGRDGLYDLFARAEFDVAEATALDFSSALTVWGISLGRLVRYYEHAYCEGRDFPEEDPFRRPLPPKTQGEAVSMATGYMKNLEQGLPPWRASAVGDPDRLLDFHRTIWVKHGREMMIVDGTHRAVALLWYETRGARPPLPWPVHIFAGK